MNAAISWAPPQASDMAVRVDSIFDTLLGLTGTVAIAIFLTIIAFCVIYRRGSSADRTRPPTRQPILESAWILTPLALFIGIFIWAAVVYADFYGHDRAMVTVFIVGKQWMWRAEHQNGRREINELHLPAGQRVRLVLTTQDVIHSFFIPAFRVKQDAVPGRYTTMQFVPTTPGEYRLHCAEYCGTDHAAMGGRIIVMPPAEFSRWLEGPGGGNPEAKRGSELFRSSGCAECHDSRADDRAPRLSGIFGREVRLSSGRTVRADEQYLRDSILFPDKDIVAGFEPTMPSFQGRLDEDDISTLIQYLKEAR